MATPHKHLFFDDRWIARSYAVHRRICAFEKLPDNPILTPEHPWEGASIYCFGSCIEEHGRFRLWYQVYDAQAMDTRFRTAVGYAESLDGIHWEKPLIGAKHPTHGQTNLVVLSSGRSHLYSPSVVRDDDDQDPAARYKMLLWDAMDEDALSRYGTSFETCADLPGWRGVAGEGLFLLNSADGIRWTRQSRPVFGSPSDAAAMCRTDQGEFIATFKISVRDDRHFRVVAESTSPDFRNWTSPQVVLEPDWLDPIGTELYGMASFDYFGNRLGLLWMYHNSPDNKTMDVQLAAWQVGTGWQRAGDRQPILATGGRGAWDAGLVVTSSAPVIAPGPEPDALWLYYGGGNVRHDDSRYRRNGIGLARMRLDGFAAMESCHFPGRLVSRPVIPTGPLLHLNLAARHGEVTVIVRDFESDQVLASSKPLRDIDAVDVVVVWQHGEWSSGRAVTLEFALCNAALYAFWFGPGAL